MTELAQRTYALLSRVPKGKVTTYKSLGMALGTKAYRAIGQIMRTNPHAPEVPCHRVVASSGAIGGYMGVREGKEISKKIALLKSEGVNVVNGRIENFAEILYNFS